jgi:amino acid transporter
LADSTDKGVFLRKASGLIKIASSWDVFIFNVGLINIGLGIAFLLLYGNAFYYGADSVLGSIISTLIWIPIALGFYMWALIFPRSGGSYVFPGRSYHPLLGMVVGFNEAFAFLFFTGVPAAWISEIGLSNMFFSLGLIANQPSLTRLGSTVIQFNYVFIIGIIAIVVIGALVASGTRNFFKVQKILFAISMVGIALMIYYMAATPLAQAKQILNGYLNPVFGSNDTYDFMITQAQSAGWSNPGFSTSQTIRMLVWPSLPFIGAIGSIAISGEIKKLARSQFVGIVGSVLFVGAWFILATFMAVRSLGYNFLGAAGFLTAVPSSKFPVTLWPATYGALLSQNAVVGFIITLAFAIAPYFWMGASILYADRTLLAMSLDRMLPDAVGSVNERTHTPLVAVLIAVAWSIGSLYVFIGPLASVPPTAALFYLWWMVLMLTGIPFPWIRRYIFDKSAVANWKIGPLPVFSLVCAIAAAGTGALTYLIITDPIAGGPILSQLITMLIYAAIPISIYFIMVNYRKRQGIDIFLAFREIPVE